MRIVGRKAFLEMPAGTVYAKYAPCAFEELFIKGDTIVHDERAIDWFYQDIVGAIEARDSGDLMDELELARTAGKSLRMDFETQGRDGCFEEEQLFAVWERADVEALLKRLHRTLL